ncbi:MAG: rRNA maturation RNase YbeY [Burkholderiaceae bacterium]
MMLPALALSLQFALPRKALRHRAALPRHAVRRWIRHALQDAAQITVRIVDVEEGRSLNREYRCKDHATNVLTFAYGGTLLTADLVLCAPVVEREAKKLRKPLKAHYAHLIVHASLHAQGWDHETSSADAQAMEAQEVAILAGLGFTNPYR